jgi:hypothetical protein
MMWIHAVTASPETSPPLALILALPREGEGRPPLPPAPWCGQTNRNSQSGLYEYDYRSKVEYKPDPAEQNTSALTTQSEQADAGAGVKHKPSAKPLSGAAASAASV